MEISMYIRTWLTDKLWTPLEDELCPGRLMRGVGPHARYMVTKYGRNVQVRIDRGRRLAATGAEGERHDRNVRP